MFRLVVRAASRAVASNSLLPKTLITNPLTCNVARNFVSLIPHHVQPPSLLGQFNAVTLNNNAFTRNVIKVSLGKGRRKSERVVLTKFYRLGWGGWIRGKAGRQKKLWKKSPPRKRRLRQHVLCNAQQSHLLDKMVGSYWRRRKYFVDDPYEPYHTREEFRYTARLPKPYFPPETA